MNKKVSIITPCYNGERYIGRFLDSVLNQTYKNIEFILINDGSTDNTEKIVMSYKKLFEKSGIDLIYIYQDNAGQAVALNKGLIIFQGDYLTWPDSDDILSEDSIEKKMCFLENNKEYGLVRSDANIVKENNISNVIGSFARGNPNKFKDKLFFDFVTENNVWFAPGCYMVRGRDFLDVNPERSIYPTRAGQNWQMFLPVMYKYKCGYIDEPLYTYVIREDSHSHSIKKLIDQLKRCDDHEDVLINTINSMNIEQSEKHLYETIIAEKYTRKRFYLAVQLKDKNTYKKEFKLLSNKKHLNKKDRIIYFLAQINLYNSMTKIKNAISKILNVN